MLAKAKVHAIMIIIIKRTILHVFMTIECARHCQYYVVFSCLYKSVVAHIIRMIIVCLQ